MFPHAFHRARILVACTLCSVLSGCAGYDGGSHTAATGYHAVTSSLKDPPSGLSTLPVALPAVAARPVKRVNPPAPPPDDTAGCGTSERCALLRRMVEDPDRRWIADRPLPSAYMDGTRLFAYRALRAKLSCSELGLALEDTRAAASFASPGSPEQVVRTRALSLEVEGELQTEHAKRCDVSSQPRPSS